MKRTHPNKSEHTQSQTTKELAESDSSHKKIILFRCDDIPSIEASRVTKYTCTPAQHMQLSKTQGLYEQSGYVSFFLYAPTVPSYDPSIPQFLTSMNSGELASSKFVHFVILDERLFEERIVLTGGTSGLHNQGEGIVEPGITKGSVHDHHQFDKQYPQIFDTRYVDVQLRQGEIRTDSEFLLGGNWQEYALCTTMFRDQFNIYFKQYNTHTKPYPAPNELANLLIKGIVTGMTFIIARNIKNHSLSEVEELNQNAVNNHFAPMMQERENKRRRIAEDNIRYKKDEEEAVRHQQSSQKKQLPQRKTVKSPALSSTYLRKVIVNILIKYQIDIPPSTKSLNQYKNYAILKLSNMRKSDPSSKELKNILSLMTHINKASAEEIPEKFRPEQPREKRIETAASPSPRLFDRPIDIDIHGEWNNKPVIARLNTRNSIIVLTFRDNNDSRNFVDVITQNSGITQAQFKSTDYAEITISPLRPQNIEDMKRIMDIISREINQTPPTPKRV